MESLYDIAVALNLERLYNRTSDLGIDYEKGYQNIFTDFDKCTLCYGSESETLQYLDDTMDIWCINFLPLKIIIIMIS